MTVKSLLAKKSGDVITVGPDHTLHEASQLLARHNIGAVIVVDGDGKPVGILSERDIVRKLAEDGSNCLTLSIGEVMTKDLIIAVLEDELGYLSNIMTDKRIRHLPVMHGDDLVGIVSIGDVVKAQRDQFKGEARMYEQYIHGTRA
jgi:CBS domain-containing protein